NGTTTWLLSGNDAGQSEQLQQVSLKGDALARSTALALPTPLANAHAAALDGALFVTGVDGSGATRLYRKPADAPQWQPQPLWPGAAAAVALQGQKGALYVVAGANGAQQLLRWTSEKGWHALPAIGGDVVPGSLRALGQAHLLMQVSDAAGNSHARSFHTITSAWADVPDTAANAPLASASWGNGLAWANADGSLHTFELQSGKHLLGWLDWSVIIIYLA
ncbi:MAG: sodium:solute symporter, partial [Stenotrophomonas sp.]